MSDLLFPMTMLGAPAAMLLASFLSRHGISRSSAMAVVLAAAALGAAMLYRGVIDTYARFGESEGNGALASAYLIAIVWLVIASFSLFSISRAGAATQLGSESEK